MTSLHPVRSQTPARREDVATQTRYSLYRDDLRMDFNMACGYCGADDERTDPVTFHIDHFAPLKLFPDLKTAYYNLVYACRFCNVSKSDHWVGTDCKIANNGTEGFIDPCEEDFDLHLGRDSTGQIVAKTVLGEYMKRRLSLHLLRHELLWKARRTRAMRAEIAELIEAFKERKQKPPKFTTLLERFYDLSKMIDDYELRAVRP